MPTAAPAAVPSAAPTASPSVRVRLDLAYDGAGFHGWAAQPGLRTVEGVLTQAFTTVARTPVRLTVAGRTDSGVHAAHQVAHLELPAQVWAVLPDRGGRTPEVSLVSRLAGVLAREASTAGVGAPRGASDVVVHTARPVPAAFDARFSALTRRYRYRIADRPGLCDPARRGHVLWLDGPLDVEAMAASSTTLLGEHDFLAYCRPREGASTIRTLHEVTWHRVSRAGGGDGDAGLVVLDVVADAFCHSMVRSLVGAGLAVGRGQRPISWPAQLLASRSRTTAAPVAPAHGLTLEEVIYPADDELAAQARRARVLRTRVDDCCS